MPEFIFDAFISYSHRDIGAAARLQKKLENFRVPGGLAPDQGKELYRKPRERLHVFRDQTDLAGAELTAALRENLRAARYLVVVCSPAAAASHWVNEEILYFRSLGRDDYIVPYIIGGEPESADPSAECYPPALRYDDGRHQLGANVREIGEGRAFLKTASVLIGVRFGRLVDREKQRRRRTAVTACLAGTLVLSVISFLLIRNRRIEKEREDLAYNVFIGDILSGRSAFTPENLQPEDLVYLRASAEAGNNMARGLLASCCLNGWGTELDEAEAFSWYRLAAEDGDPDGMTGLSNCYFHGWGTEKDLSQSLRWMKQAAELGVTDAMVNVGIACEEGNGTDADPEEAYAWYVRAAEAGSEIGMYNAGRCCILGIGTEEDPEAAFSWMSRLAETGNTYGLYNRGLMYREGLGTKQDPRQAYLDFRAAAEAGDKDAMYWTAWCIENGFGTNGEDIEWYERAAAAGHEKAAAEAERLLQERLPSGQEEEAVSE